MRNIKSLIKKFLKLKKISFDEKRLELLVDSHPDFLLLNNITDTFDNLDIPNAAVEISLNQLTKMQLPVITSIYLDDVPQFAIINKLENQSVHLILENLDKLEIFSKVFFKLDHLNIVLVGKQKRGLFDRHKLQKNWQFYFLGFSILLLIIPYQFRLNDIIYNFLTICGLLITFLIFLKENNINSIADKFCMDSENSSCSKVLSSKGSKLFGNLKLSDLSMLYFGILFILSNFGVEKNYKVKIILNAISLLIVPFSILYQWAVVKKWCRLCLSILVILIAQFSLITISFKDFSFENLNQLILPIVFSSIVTISFWTLLRQSMLEKKNNTVNELTALKFNRNYKLFLAHLENQPLLSITNFSSPIIFGNKNARLKIIVVSNPLCEPCAQVHQIFNKLLERFPNDILVEYCFYCNPENLTDRKTLISSYLIQASLHASEIEIKKLLDNWYQEKIISGFNNAYSVNKEILDFYIRPFYQFREINKISVAPAIIINGKLVSMPYSADSLLWLMPYIIDHFTTINQYESNILLQQKAQAITAI